MKISASKLHVLEDSNVITPFYKVKNPLANYSNEFARYSYYSKSVKHISYYLAKKIIQVVSIRYDININNPRDSKLIGKISYILSCLQNDTSLNFELHLFYLNSIIRTLFEQNSYSNHNPHRPDIVERVDTRIYGGGYGIIGTWRELFEMLTICSRHELLSNNDLIIFFESLQKLLVEFSSSKFGSLKIEAAANLLNLELPYTINNDILDTDYYDKVLEKLWKLSEEKLLHPGSDIIKAPEIIIPKYLNIIKFNQEETLERIRK